MRRITLILIFMCALFGARSKVPKPDFAFPQTVSKNAGADLDKAVADKDAAKAINALLRLYVADKLIDTQSIPASIALAEKTAATFSGDSLYGIFLALQARMYADFLDDNWKAHYRDIPLTPLPADLNEWSGRQLQTRIDSLYREAYSEANARQLAMLKTVAYPMIVESNAESQRIYPTLLDFVFCNSSDNDRDLSTSIIAEALKWQQPYTDADLYWRVRKIEQAPYAQQSAALVNLYKECPPNQNKGYVLVSLGSFMQGIINGLESSTGEKRKDSIDMLSEYLRMADDYIARYGTSMYTATVKHYRNVILKKEVNVIYPDFAYPGDEITLTVRNYNIGKLTIELYRISNPQRKPSLQIKNASQFFSANKPVATATVERADTLPFFVEQEVRIKVPADGYYIALPRFKDEANETLYPDIIYSCPVMPLAFTNCANPKVAIVDAHTGLPVADAGVTVKGERDNTAYQAVTDADGVASFGNAVLDYRHDNLEVTVKGKTYYFPDAGPRTGESRDKASTPAAARVFTDRALYHPGENVNFLGVLYADDTDSAGKIHRSVLSDTDVMAVLFDANSQPVDTMRCSTDGFGRCTGMFTLPVEGLTGNFCISIQHDNDIMDKSPRIAMFARNLGTCHFMVSDYKLPDSRIDDVVVERNVPQEGDVTVSGRLLTYSGMPVAGADINYTLKGYQFFGFLGGRGQSIIAKDSQTDSDGRFSVVFADNDFHGVDEAAVDDIDDVNEIFRYYSVSIEAVTPSGTTASDIAYFSLGKQYTIEIGDIPACVDGTKAFAPKATVYSASRDVVDLPLRWYIKDRDDKTVAEGDYPSTTDISGLVPGMYTYCVVTADESLADMATKVFSVYNTTTDIVPGTAPLWILNKEVDLPADGVIDILAGTNKDALPVYVAVVDRDTVTSIYPVTLAKGYGHIKVKVDTESYNQYIFIGYINDFRKGCQRISLRLPATPVLRIEAETMRDYLVPLQEETWRLRVVGSDGAPVQAALALDMYNKSLDALSQHNFSLYFPTYSQCYIPFDITSPYCSMNDVSRGSVIKNFRIPSFVYSPTFLYLDNQQRGVRSKTFSLNCLSMPTGMAEECSMADYSAPMPSMSMDKIRGRGADNGIEESVAEEPAETEEAAPQTDTEVYRDGEVALGLWAPSLTTDADGCAVCTFTVPNANTTWRLMATAWTGDLTAGNLVKELVASKPVMVLPNQPRFMRAGDKAVFRATTLNNSEETATVRTVLEVFNPLNDTVITSHEYTDVIDAKGNATNDIEYTASSDVATVAFRVRATIVTDAATFTDGEQHLIPVLTNEAQLIETTPFYLNPGDTEYTQRLPKGKDARLTLTFCENPAWTVVTALPGLRTDIAEYANAAAAAIFSASVSKGITDANPKIGEVIKRWRSNPTDSALVSMLEKNEDLKQAVLNCTPWVQAAKSDTERMANLAMIFDNDEIEAAVNKGVTILEKLQMSDGGWAWGDWCEESSLWITGNVLSMMSELTDYGWLPADKRLAKMIDKALAFCDSKVKDTDILYAIYRPSFANEISANGKKVINKTLADISADWKQYTDPAYKAMAAVALWGNGRKDQARRIMESVAEFGVYSPSQGLRFPAVNALYNYAIILDAFARIMPGSKEVDALRQQLIVRKQATDWGDAVTTTEVVASILSAGSDWLADSRGAVIDVDGKALTPQSPVETATGNLRADLSAYAGKRLTITTPGAGPAYGAVYSQFSQAMTEVKSVSIDDLSIEKIMYVRRGTEWELITDKTNLSVGDRLKVQLTIHSKRNMNYVSITDERPAALEPVVQLPGWEWSEGAAFYRENRDACTTMHIAYLRPGTYLLSYEMNVNTAGVYSSGVATIQSQYAPELTAHSAGHIFKVAVD